jgi:hypothetical protein
MPPVLSMKKPDKQAVSLTDLTQRELAARGEAAAAAAAAAAAEVAAAVPNSL